LRRRRGGSRNEHGVRRRSRAKTVLRTRGSHRCRLRPRSPRPASRRRARPAGTDACPGTG
jgi:hypothetical protein